jgi:predicted dehydrogenase
MFKVIQVGIGGMGNTWLKAVQASQEVEFVGFVEVNPTIAAQQVKAYGLDESAVFGSLENALDALMPDGIIDVTPPRFHKSISLQALDAGLPVLSEKPLSDTLADAQAIVQKANETGVLHMVAQNYRYSAAAQTVKQVLQSGQMGQVGSVTIEFFKGPHFGGFRDEMPYPLIIDMAIHHFDMMRFFLESDPVSIYGQSWNPPWSWYRGDAAASVALRFANGVAVAYNGSWASSGRNTSWNGTWRFECENGILLFENDQVFIERKGAELAYVNGMRQFPNDPPVVIEPVTPAYTAQAYLLHEFFEAVTLGKPPATTCQDNIKSLSIVFDTVKSFETGLRIDRPISVI